MMTQFQEGSWIWIRTGESLDFSAWNTGEPNNTYNNENCLWLEKFENNADFKWVDSRCFLNAKPICQREFTIVEQ